mmetsp:Transcript_36003/g.69944  ORF Transcript_36003/g.69944 Transcript_36003/m.69944 type:complete len:262 (-) Transcript_36003:81-866(-)
MATTDATDDMVLYTREELLSFSTKSQLKQPPAEMADLTRLVRKNARLRGRKSKNDKNKSDRRHKAGKSSLLHPEREKKESVAPPAHEHLLELCGNLEENIKIQLTQARVDSEAECGSMESEQGEKASSSVVAILFRIRDAIIEAQCYREERLVDLKELTSAVAAREKRRQDLLSELEKKREDLVDVLDQPVARRTVAQLVMEDETIPPAKKMEILMQARSKIEARMLGLCQHEVDTGNNSFDKAMQSIKIHDYKDRRKGRR